MKIVVVDGRTLSAEDNPWTALHQLGEVAIYERSSEEEIVARGQGAGILITNKARVPGSVIEQLGELRFIAVSATGYDCVDVVTARRRGIPVANVPEYGTHSVAQFVLALVLHLCHRVDLHVQAVQAGEWSRCPEFSFWKTPQVELAGKIMGVVGMGRIGSRVGELAHAFGMEVLAHSRNTQKTPAYRPFAWVDLDELFRRADVISLHCPLTDATKGMVNEDRLNLVQPHALLINTSRGGLVVEEDLADALDRGKLAGAALDVVAHEPILPDNPLLKAKNCFLTPHMAWSTREARRRLLAATVANVANFLSGRPTHIVN